MSGENMAAGILLPIPTPNEIYGVWKSDGARSGWIIERSGVPAMFGKQQAIDFCVHQPNLELRRLYICCEDLDKSPRCPKCGSTNYANFLVEQCGNCGYGD